MASVPATPIDQSSQDPVEYLRSLASIRARCTQVHDLATKGRLLYFDYHPEKEEEVVEFCKRVIEVRIAIVLAFRILLSPTPTGGRIFQFRRSMFSTTFSGYSITLLGPAALLDSASWTLATF